MAGKETSSGALWCKHPVAVQLSLGTAPDNYHLKHPCRQLPSLEDKTSLLTTASTNQTSSCISGATRYLQASDDYRDDTKLLHKVSKNSYQVGISDSQRLVTIANKYENTCFYPATIPIKRRSSCCQRKLTDCSCFILLLGDVGVKNQPILRKP